MERALMILNYARKRIGDIKDGESADVVLAEMNMAAKTLEAFPSYSESYIKTNIISAMFGTTEVKADAE